MPLFTTQAAIEQKLLEQTFRNRQSLNDQLFRQSQQLESQQQAGRVELQNLRQQGAMALQDDQQAFELPNQQSLIQFRADQTQIARMGLIQSSAAAAAERNKLIQQWTDDVNREFGSWREVVLARGQVSQMLQTGTPLGGVSAIITLAKALDPKSSVREGEVNTIEGGVGKIAQLQNAWNRMAGEGMTPESLAQFQEVVDLLTAEVALQALQRAEGFGAIFNGVGLSAQAASIFQAAGVNPENMAILAIPAMNEQQQAYYQQVFGGR